MTHEQKPEGAEFRAREAQIRELCASCHFEEVATAHVIEAEARGAAEQRRKDAKVKPSKPSAYIHTMYYSGERGNKPQKRLSFSSEKEAVFGEKGVDYDPTYLVRVKSLFTRPANVAALEARVKELEQVLAEIAHNKTSDCPNADNRLYQDQLAWAAEWCRRKARTAIREGGEHV